MWRCGCLLIASLAMAAQGQSLDGWSPFWLREKDAGSAVLEANARDGRAAVRVEHRGTKDWSLARPKLQAAPGDILEISAWGKLQSGSASLSVVTADAAGKTIEWIYGERAFTIGDWQELRFRIIVPRGAASVVPRLTGYGPAVISIQSFSIAKKGSMTAGRDLALTLLLENAHLSVTFDTAKATLAVLDKRTKQTWQQQSPSGDIMITGAKAGKRMELDLVHLASTLEFKATVELAEDAPELLVSVAGQGSLSRSVAFPSPFVSEKGSYLVVPMNEGISYPVDDASIPPMHLIAYGGHGICMGFWGVTDDQRGHMAIIETSDDCSIRIARQGNLLCIGPEWDPQKGQFGYERKLRYVFFDKGGHVAMCKRYREHAKQIGLLRTFDEKRKANPNIDLLIGAVNVWCWDRDALPIVKDLQAAGIDRILWSNRANPETIAAMNQLGVLTSRYDIYQDAMNPADFPLLRWKHPDWTSDAWANKDLMLNARGDWIRGWEVEGKDGKMYPCGVLCDRQAPAYAQRRIPEELKTHPYRCRFIDTTTASPWRECYDEKHPCTRTDSRKFKMDLLKFVSQDCKLVTGCETGHDAAVPYCDYFEGMLSLGPYRVPDSGRAMQKIWEEVPANVAKFQVGWQYRLPLWELVYHDCVVAQWYWGDYNNKLPALWDKRDQFNALYGTPPMFMFSRDLWQKNNQRFVQSYRATAPVARATGYSEMIDHRFLTADRSVQQTVFANGVKVTVNFGSNESAHVEGIK